MQRTAWIFLSLLIAVVISASLLGCAPDEGTQVRSSVPADPGPSKDGPPVQPTPGPHRMDCLRSGVVNPSIFGGERAAPESWLGRTVVSVVELNSRGIRSMCTGTLIDRNLVLTAAHCVDEFARPEYTIVGFSNDPLCDANNTGMETFREVEAVEIHPDYSTTDRSDLAMIRFRGEAPFGSSSLQLAGKARLLEATTGLLLAGHGKENDYNSVFPERLDLKFTHVRPFFGLNPSKSGQQMTSPLLFLDQREGHGACAGDSGGPAMVANEWGGFDVIGVASRVDPLDDPDFQVQSDVTCFKGIIYTSTLYERPWIEAAFSRMKSPGSARTTPFSE